MTGDGTGQPMKRRADLFRYLGLDVDSNTLRARYDLDGVVFEETVTFEGVGPLDEPAVRSVAELWYLVTGLSYYKAGAAREVDLGTTTLGVAGEAFFRAALVDGLGEYAYRNDLWLDDVTIRGGTAVESSEVRTDPERVLTPFGGGIDSVVTTARLSRALDQALFIVSPASGRFEPLERTASVTGLPIVRARRTLDEKILRGDDAYFNGHVPVTAMVTLLAAVAGLASGRGGVVMSNEHSASEPNLRWHDRDVNHQWSKSWVAEELIGAALEERVGTNVVVASFLRDRSELWVAQQFAKLSAFHHVFRSCNRAFHQEPSARLGNWCGVCDKCLFINLILAPFVTREHLRSIFGSEPLADPSLEPQLRSLVGIGHEHKPFECVGDPGESAVALARVAALDAWADVAFLGATARLASPERTFDELLEPQGPSRVPAHWLR
ncbi:MAG: hypothetical protein WAN30_00740 [Acidimicrobiales bacterium]